MSPQIKIDADYVVKTTQQLVQIDSTSPSLSSDGAGETAIAQAVANHLNAYNIPVDQIEISPNRWNVIGTLKGRGSGRSLLLNAHMDTVGVTGMAEPFSGDIRDGKLYGRGSYDMKASLAAQLGVVKALFDAGVRLGGDLLVTAVADEEDKSIGTEHLLRHYSADAAIVTEPTDLSICRAHRGFIWFDVETIGRAAHGSRYQEGIDANMRMGRFLSQLEQLEQALLQRSPHPLAGPPSLHAALLHGGTEISVYAARCLLRMERRTIPGETVEQASTELQNIIKQLTAADPTFQASARATFWREPFSIRQDATIVQVLEHAAQSYFGKAPSHIGQTFWTDAALFADAGIETVIFGPSGAGLHSAEEWVDVQSTVDLGQILLDTVLAYCK